MRMWIIVNWILHSLGWNMQFHRPILDLRIVFIMRRTHRSHHLDYRNVVGIILIHPNKYNALNLFMQQNVQTEVNDVLFSHSPSPMSSNVYKNQLRTVVWFEHPTMQQLFSRACFVNSLWAVKINMDFFYVREENESPHILVSLVSRISEYCSEEVFTLPFAAIRFYQD